MFSQKNSKLQKKGWCVKPSPFNKTKLKLAVVLILIPTLWIIVHTLVNNLFVQLALLGSYSLLMSVWLLYGIRSILLNKQPVVPADVCNGGFLRGSMQSPPLSSSKSYAFAQNKNTGSYSRCIQREQLNKQPQAASSHHEIK